MATTAQELQTTKTMLPPGPRRLPYIGNLLSLRLDPHHILAFLAAGHETTAIALVWTFYLLSQYPQVRIKLQDEIRSVLAGRDPTLEDLNKLPYFA